MVLMFECIFPWILGMLGMLIMVPFYTMVERKVLSYIQVRKGPKKVSFLGLLQPMADGIKLFFKESSFPLSGNILTFFLAPILNFMFVLACMFILGFSSKFVYWGSLFFFVFMSLNTYTVLGAAWASKSKYCKLSSVRMISQVVSYEVLLFSVFLMFFWFSHSSKMEDIQAELWSIMKVLFTIVLFCLFLIETKRSPFDFSEGESELVSGYKLEFSSFFFALLSLSEYGSMVMSSMLLSSMCFCSWSSQIFFSLSFVLSFLWMRGALPRFRYDFLMDFCWQILLVFTFMLLWMVFM